MKWVTRGFTLVETIMATSLMVLVLISALGIMGAGLKWWQHGWDRMDAQQNARVGILHMVNDIRVARAVATGSNTGTLIITNRDGSQYKYELAGDNLRRLVKQKGASGFDYHGYNILAYGVKSIAFTYDRPENPEKSKTVSLEVVTRDREGAEFLVKTAVTLRLAHINGGS